jgi:hypothetical protein
MHEQEHDSRRTGMRAYFHVHVSLFLPFNMFFFFPIGACMKSDIHSSVSVTPGDTNLKILTDMNGNHSILQGFGLRLAKPLSGPLTAGYPAKLPAVAEVWLQYQQQLLCSLLQNDPD